MKNVWTWIVVAVVIVGGAFWWWQSSQTPTANEGSAPQVGTTNAGNTPTSAAQPSDQGSGVNAGVNVNVVASAPTSATITYNGSGFSPSSVTIKQGGTVTFISTAGDMWVASAPHPSHTGYDGTTRDQHCAPGYSGPAPFDQCAPGGSFSFTFGKVGTWPFHDHLNTGVYGAVNVVQ